MRDSLYCSDIFPGLTRTINNLAIYIPLVFWELKLLGRNPPVISLLQNIMAHDLMEVLLSSMKGTGAILDMEEVMGSELACHAEIKLTYNSWTARLSIKFLIFS